MIKALLKDEAVSLMLSIAHFITFNAVSTPNEYSLFTMSLSIVAGIPMKFISVCSPEKILKPLNEPSPPRTIKLEIELSFKFL
jgi:hypothetical protein